MSQTPVECGKTVSKRWLTVFLALLMQATFHGNAKSEIVISTGLSNNEELLPFVAVNINDAWTVSQWNLSTLMTARGQYEGGIGDAQAKLEWHGDTELSSNTELELDATYGFDRERTDAIKQFHILRGDFGIAHEFDNFKLKADVGAETQRFQDTTQKGYSPLDRTSENFLESEAAVRLTIFHEAAVQPFIEAAYIERNYFNSPDRGFAGPEFIGGVTFSHSKLSGDLAIIFASRDTSDGKTTTVVGPYVDLKWSVNNGSDVTLGMGAGIEQDTSGLADLYPYYSARLDVSHDLSTNLKLSFLVDAIAEKRVTGTEIELSPTISLAWAHDNSLGLFGSAGLSYTRIQNFKSGLETNFEMGMKWTF
jgi:hypothetical protein